jgi:argininosuccinate synthase
MTKKAVLAFSGGLDTTYCAVWLREAGYAVHSVVVQTGGFDADELAAIERRARGLGVAEHVTIDARDELFSEYLRYLIFANALRGNVYPLCVSAERVAQAKCVARYAASIGAAALVHGSTGAGNDQVRFDTAFRILAPDATILAPIRQQAVSREFETAWLAERGVVVPPKTSKYSVNRGLWGATIGGLETHRSDGVLPEEAYLLTLPPSQRPTEPQNVKIQFDRGVPVRLDGSPLEPVALIGQLGDTAGRHGVGRGMHVGDTILGIKGRVAFEAPAATTLIAAHRELEKLVLSRQQLFWKATLGDLYGSMLHESRYFDPLMRDLEAFLASSQQRVSGSVMLRLFQGHATVEGATSPYSLMDRDVALYGEESSLWSGNEAAAFSKIYGLPDALFDRAGKKGDVDATVGG